MIIKGYENYEISSLGRVKSKDRVVSCCGGKRKFSYHRNEAVLTEHIVGGYMQIQLMKNSKNKGFKIHRLVAEAFIPNPKNKPHVNHKDGNKLNNNITNLEWCDRFENMRHAYKNGLLRLKCGIYSHKAKLTEEQVKLIRSQWASGEKSQKEIGRIYGVGQGCISKIVRREKWKHLS